MRGRPLDPPAFCSYHATLPGTHTVSSAAHDSPRLIATEEAVLFPDVLAALERAIYTLADQDQRWWKALLTVRVPPALLRRLLRVGVFRRWSQQVSDTRRRGRSPYRRS
jgi:hypothetical protein